MFYFLSLFLRNNKHKWKFLEIYIRGVDDLDFVKNARRKNLFIKYCYKTAENENAARIHANSTVLEIYLLTINV